MKDLQPGFCASERAGADQRAPSPHLMSDRVTAEDSKDLVAELAQAIFPWACGRRHVDLGTRQVHCRVHELALVAEVPVERHRPDAQLGSDPAHRDPIDALARQEGERCFGYSLAGQLGCRLGWHFRTMYGTLYE